MKINLTTTLGHDWEDVHELDEPTYKELVELLTITKLPDYAELRFRAHQIASLANVVLSNGRSVSTQGLSLVVGKLQYREAVIGGFAGLMKPLHEELEKLKIIPLYPFEAFVEVEESKGTGVRHARYQHVGFVDEGEYRRVKLITPTNMYVETSWKAIWNKLPIHKFGWTYIEFRKMTEHATPDGVLDLTVVRKEPLGMSVSRKTNGLSDWDSQW